MMAGIGRRGSRWGVAAIVAVLLAALVTGCGGSSDDSSASDSASLDGSGFPNVDLANTRNTGKSPLTPENAGELTTSWALPIQGESSFGGHASSPISSEGVLYSQDLASNVQAIDNETGKVLWTKKYAQPSLGPNGITVQDGKVVGTTPTAVFALDQETGEELWTTTLTRNEVEGIDMAPGYYDGTVYASTVPVNAASLYEPGGVGVLWALDAESGKKLWHFDTVPRNLWGNPKVNSGGGVWYTPAFDDKGSMYFGVGNPAPFPGSAKDPWGSSRPGRNLYTNSIVKLDAKTGKLDWYFQLNPHDLYDWDLQGPPMLIDSGGRELVVAAGKVGYVIALDAKTGKLVWKRAVGKHNGHDEDGLLAMKGEYSKLKTPFEIYPGTLGGVIAPMSTDGSRVFVPVVNHPVTVSSGSEISEASAVNKGELVALNVKNGSLAWKREYPLAPAFGATTVAGPLVFATTYDGRVYGYETKSGNPVWEAQLSAGINTGVTIDGEWLFAPAGLAVAEGQTPQIEAYHLGGVPVN